MFHGLLPIITLCGALLLTFVAVMVVVQSGRAQGRSLASTKLGSGSADSPARPDRGAQRLAALVSGEGGGQITARTGQRPAAGDLASGAPRLSPDVASGLQMICQAAPEVGLHPGNIELLAHLREVTGANDFRFLCGQLASALNDPDPRFRDLAAGLERGDLTWSQFLSEMRSMPMSALPS